MTVQTMTVQTMTSENIATAISMHRAKAPVRAAPTAAKAETVARPQIARNNAPKYLDDDESFQMARQIYRVSNSGIALPSTTTFTSGLVSDKITPLLDKPKQAKACAIIAEKKFSLPNWACTILSLIFPLLIIGLVIEQLLIAHHEKVLTEKFSSILASLQSSSQELSQVIKALPQDGNLTQQEALGVLIKLSQFNGDVEKFIKELEALGIQDPNGGDYISELFRLKNKLQCIGTPELMKIFSNSDFKLLKDIQKDLDRNSLISLTTPLGTYNFTKGNTALQLVCVLAQSGLTQDEIFYSLVNAHQGIFSDSIKTITETECVPDPVLGNMSNPTYLDNKSGVERVFKVSIKISEQAIQLTGEGQMVIVEGNATF